jgi:hypothetical protein
MRTSRLARSPSFAALALAALLGLSGCGGGGDDGGSSGQVFDARAAVLNLLTLGGSWRATGLGSDRRSYTFDYRAAPQTPGVFALTGASHARAALTLRLSLAGAPVLEDVSTLFFDAGTGSLRGSVDSDGACTRIVGYTAPPTAARVGDTGDFYTAESLSSCTGTAVVEDLSVVRWAVIADNGVALFCSDTEARDAANALIGRSRECFEVSPTGTLGVRSLLRLELPGLLTLEARG